MTMTTDSDYSREIRFSALSSRRPIDLTGFQLEMVIKAQRGAAVPLMTLTLGAGLTITDAAEGAVVMELTAQQMAQIGAGQRVWGIYRVDGARRLALATGKMIVREGL